VEEGKRRVRVEGQEGNDGEGRKTNSVCASELADE
jgi:hypothetical protein